MGSAKIVFELDSKQNATYASNAQSLTGVSMLARHLARYSVAGIPRVSYTESKFLDLRPDAPLVPSDVGVFVNCLFRNSRTGKLAGMHIPAPNMSNLEKVEGYGYRLKQDVGEKLAAYYSTYAGQTYVFSEGWLMGASTRGNLAG